MEDPQFYNQLLQNESFLKSVALKLTHDVQDAADLHQETLCKAWERRVSYKNGIELGPWLYVIMRNTFINMYRRKKRTSKIICANTDQGQLDNRLDMSYNVDSVSTGVIISQIDKLPKLFKTPFVLYLEGYKYAEIAVALDEPIGTIKSRIFFARRLLKGMLPRD